MVQGCQNFKKYFKFTKKKSILGNDKKAGKDVRGVSRLERDGRDLT